jgi:hypothetical protein
MQNCGHPKGISLTSLPLTTLLGRTEQVQELIEAQWATQAEPSDHYVCLLAELVKLQAQYELLLAQAEDIDIDLHTSSTEEDGLGLHNLPDFAKLHAEVTQALSQTQAAMQAICPHIHSQITSNDGVYVISRQIPLFDKCTICTMRHTIHNPFHSH